jgi:tetratricopeptide (TPR) repeat protein
MGLFGFFNKSKFSKMSAQEKAREQRYAHLLCIEISSLSNRLVTLEEKISDDDFKILTIAAEAINIGSEYFDCELRKNYLANADEGDKHLKEVLSSLNIKTKRATIKQMLLVHSNIEKLECLLDENGDYILKGKYMTPIERISYLMGINEEVEDLVKNLIYELNKEEFSDHELSNSENDLTKLLSLKQRLAVLEMIVLIGSINEISDEQNNFIIDIASAFLIDPDSNVSLTEFERSNLLKDLNIDQSNYILYLITEMLKIDVLFSLNSKDELISILLGYCINESIIDKVLLSEFIEQKTDEIVDDENDSEFYFDKGFEYYMLTEYDNALIYLNKAITIDQNNSKAYHTRGNVKVELKDYSGALNDLNIAIKFDNDNFLVYRDRAELKTIINDYDEAINDFSMFIVKLQNEELTAPFYLKRGKLKFVIKDFHGAIEDSDIHINLRPDNIGGYELKGDCKFEMNNFDEAINNYNIALENSIATNNGISGEIRLKEKLSKAKEVLKHINNSTEFDSNINLTSVKKENSLINTVVENTNTFINTVETNYDFKNKIEGFIKNEKIKNFELTFSISKWYGHTPFKCSGEFEGHNFISEIVEVCKWGICEHNYKDINKLLNDIKDYEIEELHKHLDIEIISEEEDFEIDFIKWEEGTPDEFIEEIEEDWGAFDIRDNSTEEEQLDFIYKEGAVIDEIQILLSNDDSTFKLSWINSKENEENDKVISALKHDSEFNKDLLVEAITKTINALINNENIFDFKTIERDDNKSIVIDWLQSSYSINFDNSNTNLKTGVLYTDDYLSVFANVETTKEADALINSIIMLNGGISIFKQEIRNGYELFYVGNKFSISWRFSLVGLIQVDIISRESSLFDEFNTMNNQFNAHHYNLAKSNFLNDEAYLNYDIGSYHEGINSVKKALEIEPDNSGFLDTLAIGYYYSGNFKLAINISNNCIDIDIDKGTENAEHYTSRAKINIKLNHIEKAIEDLKKALELDPDFEEATQLLESLGNN